MTDILMGIQDAFTWLNILFLALGLFFGGDHWCHSGPERANGHRNRRATHLLPPDYGRHRFSGRHQQGGEPSVAALQRFYSTRPAHLKQPLRRLTAIPWLNRAKVKRP